MRQLATGIAAAALAVLASCGGAKPVEPSVANAATETRDDRSTVSVGDGPSRGSSREIRRFADGGVLELRGDRASSQNAAEQQMSSNCGTRQFDIAQEGEEMLHGSSPEAIFIAWRVHYVCLPP